MLDLRREKRLNHKRNKKCKRKTRQRVLLIQLHCFIFIFSFSLVNYQLTNKLLSIKKYLKLNNLELYVCMYVYLPINFEK